MLFLTLFASFVLATSVWCNVEKVIFVAPDPTTLLSDASIDNLLLIPLNTNHPTVRTHLNASFPTDDYAKGTESWVLLEDLSPGQRYEVRVCWLATQPTAFWLYTHTLSETFETPNLISSLSSYSYKQHSGLTKDQIRTLQDRKQKSNVQPVQSSLLFLQIHVAADYYTLNETLMNTVPPVLVDIILDPYVFNIFPKSLLPTAVYIVCIAIMAWFVASRIVVHLQQPSSTKADMASNQTDSVETKKLK